MLGLSNRQAMNSWVVEYVGSKNKLHSSTIPGIWYSHVGLTDWHASANGVALPSSTHTQIPGSYQADHCRDEVYSFQWIVSEEELS